MPDASDGLGRLRALTRRVDEAAGAISRRRRTDLRCGPGCNACCGVEPRVSPVEAEQLRLHVLSLPGVEQERLAFRAASASGRRCAMLGEAGECSVYEARPMVCRMQGLPLRYPEGFVPVEAVMGRVRSDPVVWCPRNFTETPPRTEDVVDAERVDTLLGLANLQLCEERDRDPLGLASLRDVVAAAVPSARVLEARRP